uniref:Uncharacterized protein n=1 Tax=Parascaris univalens TaxID=6257 RepID=A0A915B244_PARUN
IELSNDCSVTAIPLHITAHQKYAVMKRKQCRTRSIYYIDMSSETGKHIHCVLQEFLRTFCECNHGYSYDMKVCENMQNTCPDSSYLILSDRRSDDGSKDDVSFPLTSLTFSLLSCSETKQTTHLS